MPQAETLFKPLLKNALDVSVGGTNPFCGRTTVGSGVATVTVSTTVVNSDSLILMGMQIASGGITSSAGAMVVNSVVPGVSFALARDSGVASPWTTTAMWMIINPKE